MQNRNVTCRFPRQLSFVMCNVFNDAHSHECQGSTNFLQM